MTPYFILSLIVQVGLVVHVLKTGRNMSWIFILLFFPLVGTLAYLIVELLPEFGGSPAAYRARRLLSKSINPDREFREASQRLAVADTVQNALIVAAQYLEKSQFEEARALYQRHLKGIHVDDPQLMLGLARAQFGLREYAAAATTLEAMKKAHPDQRSPEAHLLYARTQESLGLTEVALHEYGLLRRYFPGPEPTCRQALLLKSSGQTESAQVLFRKVIDESLLAGKLANRLNREWIDLAKRERGSA